MWQDADGCAGAGATTSGSDGSTPAQTGIETLERQITLMHLADEVATTSRAVEECRADPSWSGLAHDAFSAALDGLAGQIACASADLTEARR